MRFGIGRSVGLALLVFAAVRMVPSAMASSQQEVDAAITKSFQDALGRNPSPAELKAFEEKMNQEKWNGKAVTRNLMQSPEYRNHHADVIIKKAFNDLLNRDPNSMELKDLRGKIEDEGWTEKNVRDYVGKSTEYYKKHAK